MKNKFTKKEFINEPYIDSIINGQAHIKARKVPKAKYFKQKKLKKVICDIFT